VVNPVEQTANEKRKMPRCRSNSTAASKKATLSRFRQAMSESGGGGFFLDHDEDSADDADDADGDFYDKSAEEGYRAIVHACQEREDFFVDDEELDNQSSGRGAISARPATRSPKRPSIRPSL
jgi:hypothetical protein